MFGNETIFKSWKNKQKIIKHFQFLIFQESFSQQPKKMKIKWVHNVRIVAGLRCRLASSWYVWSGSGLLGRGPQMSHSNDVCDRQSHPVSPAGVFPQHASVGFTYGSAVLALFHEGSQAS